MQVSKVVKYVERMEAWIVLELPSQTVVKPMETANGITLESGKQPKYPQSVPKNGIPYKG